MFAGFGANLEIFHCENANILASKVNLTSAVLLVPSTLAEGPSDCRAQQRLKHLMFTHNCLARTWPWACLGMGSVFMENLNRMTVLGCVAKVN